MFKKLKPILYSLFFGAVFFFPGLAGAALDLEESALPDTADGAAYVTNGPVYAVKRTQDKIYIGGDFTMVGPNTGTGVPVDTATGDAAAAYPKVNNYIYASISDGSGGWYIGGNFTKLGIQTRNYIAHILADGTVDPDFDPDAEDSVLSLALSADGDILYAAGSFTFIGGESRNNIAALDAGTGAATAWDPAANDRVVSLALSPDGNTIYAGGDFTSIGGESRNNIAALSATSSVAFDWDPNADILDPWESPSVYSLAISSDGATVFAGGYFNSIGGEDRENLAAISVSTGDAVAWDPDASGLNNGIIYALALSADGNILYAGGSFNAIGGEDRVNIAALLTATGGATGWDPRIGVYEVYGGGPATVYALALNEDSSVVYVGGDFQTVGGEDRNHIAALDALTGEVTDWNPDADDSVSGFEISSDDETVYAAGSFTSIGGEDRGYLAALSASTGAATAWDPAADDYVGALVLSPDGDMIYAGGYFTSIGGESRNNIAVIDVFTGDAGAWNPDADDSVDSFALTSDGNTLYVSGRFNNIGGEDRVGIAALDVITGDATGWDPDPYAEWEAYVEELVLSSDNNTIYAVGYFDTIGGEDRVGIAALDALTGLATDWDPRANNYSRAVALSSDDSILYVGGQFSSVGGVSRNNLAALSTATGNANDWNPDADSPVNALDISPNDATVYAGGYFTTINGFAQPYFALFAAPAPIYEQIHFTIYRDDAGLAGASAYADEDENYDVEIEIPFRLRFQTVNTGGLAGDIARRLEFKEDSGSWNRVTPDSNNVRLVDSVNFTDGDATTVRLTASGNFFAGQGKDAGSDTSEISLGEDGYTEDEYSLQFEAAADGHTYRFRLTDTGAIFDNYAVAPTISPATASDENTVPLFSDIDSTSGAVVYGDEVMFSATASDPDGDDIILYICKEDDFVDGACGAGGEWCHSDPVAADPNCNYEAQSSDGSGEHLFYAYIIDENGAGFADNPRPGSFETRRASSGSRPGGDSVQTSSGGQYYLKLLQKKIDFLKLEIARVISQLQQRGITAGDNATTTVDIIGASATTTTEIAGCQITKNLYRGMRGDAQVRCLQQFLAGQGFAVIPTGDFGIITERAVVAFQEKYAAEILTPYGRTKGTGFAGLNTRMAVNRMAGW